MVGIGRDVWPGDGGPDVPQRSARPRRGPGRRGSGDRLDAAVDDDVRGMLAQGQTGIRRYGTQGERRHDELAVFVNSFAPAPDAPSGPA